MFTYTGPATPSPTKDPDSTIDYGCDWSNWLQSGETIVASTWIIQTGLTGGSETNNGTITGVMLSGGVEFEDYQITNRITTNLERVDDRSMLIKCRNK